MRKNKGQLKVIDNAPTLPAKRTDTPGNPGESYYSGRMSAVRRAWIRQFGRPHKSAADLTSAELRSIEARVRKELYP